MFLEPARTRQDVMDVMEDWYPSPLVRSNAALAYPLLQILEGPAETLSGWQARVGDWLRHRRGERRSRGIMTLRNPAGVIGALFFYSADRTAGSATLTVPTLRLVEPTGGRQVLRTVLFTLEDVAGEHACGGVLLLAEHRSASWPVVTSGLETIGSRCGFVRRGPDWFRSLEANGAIVHLPPPMTHGRRLGGGIGA